MLSPDQAQTLPLVLPLEAQNLQDPLEVQSLHPDLVQGEHEISKANKRKAELCGVAAALACFHAGYGDLQVATEALHNQVPTAVVEVVDTVYSNQIDVHNLTAHSSHQKQESQHERRAEQPDFTDLERQLEEKDSGQPPFVMHFRNRQYKHGTSRRPKSKLFRH